MDCQFRHGQYCSGIPTPLQVLLTGRGSKRLSPTPSLFNGLSGNVSKCLNVAGRSNGDVIIRVLLTNLVICPGYLFLNHEGNVTDKKGSRCSNCNEITARDRERKCCKFTKNL